MPCVLVASQDASMRRRALLCRLPGTSHSSLPARTPPKWRMWTMTWRGSWPSTIRWADSLAHCCTYKLSSAAVDSHIPTRIPVHWWDVSSWPCICRLTEDSDVRVAISSHVQLLPLAFDIDDSRQTSVTLLGSCQSSPGVCPWVRF